ncbi:hypothetical protein [Rhodococcus sp. 05-2255-1e]|uniref:hypothetical protein n=1 Tax=Rhodococcus sp. 05-2255-1e TaxID=2022495 RepID=UPI00117BC75C|nr:hypothetical protein [Rhodococcus sp. 05-2255-1e]
MWNERAIRERCAEAGMTVDQAGKRSGIVDLERELTHDQIPVVLDAQALAKTLGCHSDDLIGTIPESGHEQAL